MHLLSLLEDNIIKFKQSSVKFRQSSEFLPRPVQTLIKVKFMCRKATQISTLVHISLFSFCQLVVLIICLLLSMLLLFVFHIITTTACNNSS